jgi:hypothetical protein
LFFIFGRPARGYNPNPIWTAQRVHDAQQLATAESDSLISVFAIFMDVVVDIYRGGIVENQNCLLEINPTTAQVGGRFIVIPFEFERHK